MTRRSIGHEHPDVHVPLALTTEVRHVARATPQSLTRKEWMLLAETDNERLRAMDEDGLIELHARVRRARDRFVQLHRREVAEQVGAAGARGTASSAPRRSASKAEIFEEALARVSSSLARAARAAAAALRADRLAAARATTRPTATDKQTRPPQKTKSGAPRARSKVPIERKTAAAAKATNARRQAKRDAR
jgi:hypothetical protein